MIKKLKKLFEWYISFTFICFGVAVFYFLYLMFFPFTVVTVKEFKITEVVNGEKVCYVLNLTKYNDFKANTKFSLVDTFVYSLKNEPVYREVGTKTTYRCLQLPKTPLAKGEYHLQLDLQYLIAGIRQINYTFNTNSFVIK